MNSSLSPALENVIREAGQSWLIESISPPQRAPGFLSKLLAGVNEEAQSRLGASAPHLSEASLAAFYTAHPLQARAFLQAMGITQSPQMLLMVWRIVQGMEVKEVRIEHRRQESFHLSVALESPCGEVDAPYVSNCIHDFALLRHFGVLELDGKPVFHGFYESAAGSVRG